MGTNRDAHAAADAQGRIDFGLLHLLTVYIAFDEGHRVGVLAFCNTLAFALAQFGQLGLGDRLNRAVGPDEMGNNLPTVLLGAVVY